MIIGAQKGGTSWLAKMMRQHPDIYAPDKKELHFFNLQENYSRGIDAYRSLFDGYAGEKAIGEFTPNYLWICPNEQEISKLGVIPNIPELIHKQYPDLKLIVSLRDPVDRAVSAFMFFMRLRRYAPYKRIFDVGHTNGILSMGFYKSHLEEWMKFYPLEQFHFVCYESGIKRDKDATLKGIFRFLEVDEDFVPGNMDKKYNARMGDLYLYLNYYSPLFAKAFFRMIKAARPVNFPKISLSDEEMERLRDLYAEKNRGLDQLISCALPW